MEHFVIIVNGFQPLTIITKRSNLDVATALDPSLIQRVQEELQGTLSVSDFSDICSLFLVTNDKSILYHDNIKQISLNNDFSDSHNPRRIVWGAVQTKGNSFFGHETFLCVAACFFFFFFFFDMNIYFMQHRIFCQCGMLSRASSTTFFLSQINFLFLSTPSPVYFLCNIIFLLT